MSQSPAVLDQLTVRARVTQLLDAFYARCDHEPIADLLDEQAEFATPFRNAQGREAVTALLLSLAQSRREKGSVSRHFGANVNIEELGAGRFRVRSLMIFMSLDSTPAATGFMNVGDQDDIVVFDAQGACRFVKRAMKPIMQFALSPMASG